MVSSHRTPSRELLTPDQPARRVSESSSTYGSVATGEDNNGTTGIFDQPGETDTPMMKSFSEKARENQFSIRKGLAQRMVDLALFAANISQLRFVLKTGSENVVFYYLVLTFICLSLAGQILFALIIVIIWEREIRQETACDSVENGAGNDGNPGQRDRVTDYLNCASVIIVFIVTVLNVCISGFGVGIKQSYLLEPETPSR